VDDLLGRTMSFATLYHMMPTPGDVFVDCGEEIYDKWVKQNLVRTNVSCKVFLLLWWIATCPKGNFDPAPTPNRTGDGGKLQPCLYILYKYL
jgi:hypothetical protein